MQLNVAGEGNASDIVGVMAVGEGVSGTRIAAAAFDTYEASFFLYFKNESQLVQLLMERNNLMGEILPGGTSFVSAVNFGNGVKRSLIISPLLIILCSVLGPCLLL